MTKGQTVVIQFVLFFVIGFLIFISIGTFFRYQSDLFRQMIISSSIKMTSSYVSSAAVALVDSCKGCDFVNISIRTQNTSAGYPIDILFLGSTFKTFAPTTSELLFTTIHNLLIDTLTASGSSSSAMTIILTFDRSQNKIYLGSTVTPTTTTSTSTTTTSITTSTSTTTTTTTPTTTTTTVPPPSITEYGFNTHMYASGISNLNLTTFKQNIDDIASKGLDWIRFNVIDWEVAPSVASINWNYVNLAKYDEAINYAKNKGLKIFLVTNVPSWAKSYSLEKYKTTTQEFYSFLVNRYKDKVDVWQIFNEPNIHNYTDYSTIILTTSYLNNLNQIISIARSTIKGIDSDTLITTNVGGYPYNDILHNQWKEFFDVVGQNLDVLTLDIYPDDNIEIINALENRVNDIKSRYEKPVYIGETGICTGDGRFTESDQGYYVSRYIEEFKKSGPINIIVYEIQDDNSKVVCEATFGLKHADGTAKASYDVILNKMV